MQPLQCKPLSDLSLTSSSEPSVAPKPSVAGLRRQAQGYERLTQASRIGNFIALYPDDLYRLTLIPNTELSSRWLVDFKRFDWFLETSEFEISCWKAVYIFQAQVELERLDNGSLSHRQ